MGSGGRGGRGGRGSPDAAGAAGEAAAAWRGGVESGVRERERSGGRLGLPGPR
jgi:hypothetical protein